MVQGTEPAQFETRLSTESKYGSVLAIRNTEHSSEQFGLERNMKVTTSSPVPQVTRDVLMNVDGVEQSKEKESTEAEASQMEFGSDQASESEKGTVV